MFKRLLFITTCILLFFLSTVSFSKNNEISLKFYKTGGTKEITVAKNCLKRFEKNNPGINVELVVGPSDTNAINSFYLQLFESKSSDIDVLGIDCAMASSLSDNLLDLNKYVDEKLKAQYFQSTLEDYQVNSKLVALPYLSDVGLLFYRKDLLKKYSINVPETWNDLAKAAYIIQTKEREIGNNDFVGYLWQGMAYEGLTCNALEWIYGNNGGTIINDKREITINNPNAAKALTVASKWINTISPEGVLSMKEDSGRTVFMSGNAAFIRNWPFIYPICNGDESLIKGKVGIVEIPKGSLGKHAGMLGGWGLGVNKYSKHQDAAVKLAIYLTSAESQKENAIIAGNMPNIKELYNDKDIKKNPVFSIAHKALQSGFSRPYKQSFPHYNQVSQAFYKTVFSILKKETTSYAGLEELARKLKTITGYKIK